MLQEEVHDFYVSVVAANVQRSVSHLERTSAVSKCEYPTCALTKKKLKFKKNPKPKQARNRKNPIKLYFFGLCEKSSSLGKNHTSHESQLKCSVSASTSSLSTLRWVDPI